MKVHRPKELDPGLHVLEMMLRLRDIEVDLRQLRHFTGSGTVETETICRCLREFGFDSRIRRTDWKQLSKYPLPGIAVLRNGGFLLLGKVADDKAVVLAPDAPRPAVVSRAAFESEWDGRLLYIAADTLPRRVQRRFEEFLTSSPLTRAFGRVRHLVAGADKASGRRTDDVVGHRGSFFDRLRSSIGAGLNKEKAQAGSLVVGAVVVDFAERARKLRDTVVLKPIDEARRRSEEVAFLPAALEIAETPPSPLGRSIAISIMALFTVALAWACLGTVDVVAVAPGKVVPSGGTKSIQPFETGVVRAIRVRDGQIVKAGDVLVELDPTMTAADLGRLKGDLMAARLEVARLNAALSGERDALSAFTPPPDAPPNAVEMHRRFLTSQTTEQNAKLAAVDRQIAQKEAERATVKATIDKLVATLAPLQQKVDIREQLVLKELASKLTYLTEMQELVGQKQEIQVQQSRYLETDSAIAALAETRAKIAAEYRRGLFDELAKAEQKAAGLAQDAVKAEQRTNLQTLTAPVEGMVQQLSVHTVGGVVTPAQTLMLVVPAGSSLEVEAMISNKDVGFVESGQDVAIKIDTFNFTRYGLLHGTLLSVSQDAVTSANPHDGERSSKNAVGESRGQELVYAARISMDRSDMDIDGRRVKLAAGMASTVEIRTGSRRIVSYLLSPLLRYQHESLRER